MRLLMSAALSLSLTACLPSDASKLAGDSSQGDSDAKIDTHTSTDTSTDSSPKVSADPLADGLALIKKEAMLEELNHIASDEFQGRLSATEENEKVADWLIEHLKKLNIDPGIEGYRQRFTMPNGPTANQETANIIGRIEGTDPALKDEYIVIGAHMDHTGTLQRGYTCSPGPSGDSICNGADDNGSGTIAVLNVAKALAAVRGNLKRSVLVMWFSGEEEGLHGSKKYVQSPVVPLANTIYMVNMDMVGYARTNANRIGALGASTSSLGLGILKEAVKKHKESYVVFDDTPGGGSDHASFFRNGIPGVFFHTGVTNNQNYHRTGDHVDQIDFDGMTVAAQLAFETVLNVANSTEGMSLTERQQREPLISEEEAEKSCHSLINSPFNQGIKSQPDFTHGNDGK